MYITWLLYTMVKWSRYRPGVAQRVGRGIALLFDDHGTRRGWVVSSTPRPHFTPAKDPVPILQEAGWAPGPVRTGGNSRPHRDSIPDRPARSSVAIPTEVPGPHLLQYRTYTKGSSVWLMLVCYFPGPLFIYLAPGCYVRCGCAYNVMSVMRFPYAKGIRRKIYRSYISLKVSFYSASSKLLLGPTGLECCD